MDNKIDNKMDNKKYVENLKKKIKEIKIENKKLEKKIENKITPIADEFIYIANKLQCIIDKLLVMEKEQIAYILSIITDVIELNPCIIGVGLAFKENIVNNINVLTFTKNKTYIFAPYVYRSKYGSLIYKDIAFDGYDYTVGYSDWWEISNKIKIPNWSLPIFDIITEEEIISYNIPILKNNNVIAVLKCDIKSNDLKLLCLKKS
jgi:hypothetical protein